MTNDLSFPLPTHALDRAALLEVGCEELPAGLMPSLRESLLSGARRLREEFRLGEGDVRIFATPQRLIVFFLDLPEAQESRVERVTGPPARLVGSLPDHPSPQAIGFARNQGVPVSDLFLLETPKGAYVAVDRKLPSNPTREVLPDLFSRLLSGITLPKSMRWGEGAGPFLRPVLWILSLFGEEPVPFSFCGVSSGKQTRMPRSMGFHSLTVHHVSHYATILPEWPLLADHQKRRKAISQEIDTAVRMEGDGGLIPQGAVWVSDPELLSEVSDLVEQFRIVIGSFSSSFLALPKELVQTVLRVHQRYFVVRSKTGEPLPFFVCVAGNPHADLFIIRSGYEKVVRARLEDAQYYFDRDRMRTLSDFSRELSGLNLFPGAGTYADHALATRDLVDWFLERVPGPEILASGFSRKELSSMLGRIALVYKGDLVTGLVREFPELEGIIGGHYWKWENREILAREDGASARILLEAQAISEHYLPRFSGDVHPSSLCGKVLSSCAKYLHQVAAFKAGLAPTGSEDPYAVRRAGTGLVSLLFEGGWSISPTELAERTAGIFGETDCSLSLLNFWQERLENLLGKEAPVLLVRSAMVSPSEPFGLTRKRLSFLKALIPDPSLGAVVMLYGRVSNILEKATGSHHFDAALLQDPSEISLWSQMQQLGLGQPDPWSNLAQSGDFPEIWTKTLLLVDPVNRFFDSVLVNAPDPAVRESRLALLERLLSGIGKLGKLSYLSQILSTGEGSGDGVKA